ncbi:UDP-N-acetylmuramoyl-L-alanine--D-glutamate ligase [Caldimonas sp.]|uniref:UDP-N-acetylmuramoyl-L-alanine--D-glutamate ligase n=1 Tax=Caldimonas sp. TaxID=2838790 RepID=UPI003918B324
MKDLQGITVLVLGLGASGLAMARWCVRCGARVKVWDSREQPPQAQALRQELPQVELLSGEAVPALVEGVQRILKSPGLSPHDERLQGLLAEAARRAVPVHGELDLFARALADLRAERRYAPKIVAVTGTNGKTTTTAMAALLIERAGRRVATAGNIGPTMLDTLGRALDLEPEVPADVVQDTVPEPPLQVSAPTEDAGAVDDDTQAVEAIHEAERHIEETLEAVAALTGEDEPALRIVPPPPPPPVFEHLPEVWVLELSSFQLDGVQGFEPSAAAVLNLSQDHLDWHGSMDAYAAAKARIFGREAVMVINRDDPRVEAMVPAPQTVGKGRSAKLIERQVVRFGLDAPTHPGDYGLVVEGGMAWLVRAMASDEPQKAARRRKDDAGEELHIQRLMPADALRVRGRHNAANALAALALATSVGCPLAPMLHGLREYAGEPHRVQHVATVAGVDYVDDSKGTNVGATVAALTGLGADREGRRLLVILGGDGKGQDFTPLADPVSRHARFVALIGRDAPALECALAATGVTLARFDSLEAAVRGCAERAEPGDVVLMSPACASLDMFRNYGHRAEVFMATVRALADERGEMV